MLLGSPAQAWLEWGRPTGALMHAAKLGALTGAPAAVLARAAAALPPPPGPSTGDCAPWHVPSAEGKALALRAVSELGVPALGRVQAFLEALAVGGAPPPPLTPAATERLRRDLAILTAVVRGSATSLCDRRVEGGGGGRG